MKTLLVAVAALFVTATITASTTQLKAPAPGDNVNYQDTGGKKKKDTTKKDTSYVQYHH
jgi:hypothetical protein